MTREELQAVLDAHRLWLRADPQGRRAVLSGAVLRRADLSGADLRRADLSDADLSDADLSDADLSDADLSDADLRRADLRRAVLRGADLRRADLSGAVLRRADLSDADLSDADLRRADLRRAVLRGADLRGADLRRAVLPEAPVVENLDAEILRAIEAGGKLDMGDWHGKDACGTTHCRAGWAITLAGKAGAELEAKVGPAVAGTLIYHASTGRVPDFFCGTDAALADIRECAAKSATKDGPGA